MKTNTTSFLFACDKTKRSLSLIFLFLLGTTSPLRADDSPSVSLAHLSVNEGRTATFSPTVTATPPLSYQWFRNRELIPGATESSYTLAKATLANDVDLYAVVVSNEVGVAKAEAVLSVLPPQAAQSILNLGYSNRLAVTFSEDADPTSARRNENYLVDDNAVSQVVVINPRLVILQTKPLAPFGKHFLQIKNSSPIQIESGLKFWLRFEEKNLVNTLDFSGNGFSAALKNKTMWNEYGKMGGCLRFDGSNDYASFAEGMADFTAGMTVTVWARPATTRNYARFIDFGNGMGIDNIIFGRMADSSDLFFEVYQGKIGTGKVVASDAIENNEWQHFAATMDAKGQVKLYKNGLLVGEGLTGVPEIVSRSNNYIGRSNWPLDVDGLYEGEMDELRVYERVLTLEEITILATESGKF